MVAIRAMVAAGGDKYVRSALRAALGGTPRNFVPKLRPQFRGLVLSCRSQQFFPLELE
jgi:hypothetical protein